MILDSTIRLEAVLAGAVAANQPEVHVYYMIWNNEGMPTRPEPYRVPLNSTTDVIILTAPVPQGFSKEVLGIHIYNKDTANVVVTVKTDDGTTERIIIQRTLPTLSMLEYNKYHGWRV